MIGRNHIYFCFTKVRMDILVLQVGDDDGMNNGILLCLIYPWIERGYIYILDLFTLVLVCHIMEANDVGSSPREGIPEIKRFNNLAG